MLRRADQKAMAKRVGGVLDPATAKRWPHLADHLYQTEWEDGAARRPSTLLLMSDDGLVKGCLRDREAGLLLWASAETLEALLDAVETALGAGTGEWRRDAYAAPGKPQKGRK